MRNRKKLILLKRIIYLNKKRNFLFLAMYIA